MSTTASNQVIRNSLQRELAHARKEITEGCVKLTQAEQDEWSDHVKLVEDACKYFRAVQEELRRMQGPASRPTSTFTRRHQPQAKPPAP